MKVFLRRGMGPHTLIEERIVNTSSQFAICICSRFLILLFVLLLGACGEGRGSTPATELDRGCHGLQPHGGTSCQVAVESSENHAAKMIFDEVLQEHTGQTLAEFLERTPNPFLNETRDQESEPGEDQPYVYEDDIVIIGEDRIEMPANVFIPQTPMPPDGYPAVILCHPWAYNEHMYGKRAKDFAENGYIVLRYTSRGWATRRNGAEEDYNTGFINTIGPKDMADLGHVLDWLEENTPVDRTNIGMTGVSYGSIMSLNGVSQHDRVKTAAALSGPTDVDESFWGGETPRLIWMAILGASGIARGNLDPVLPLHFASLLSYGLGHRIGIPFWKEWAAARSPLTYIEELNASGKPVYLNCLWHDNMFQPGQHFSYYEQLTVPKKMSVRQGIHGLVPGDVWLEVYDWMDYWLKGAESGVMDGHKISMTVKNTSELISYADWPAAEVEKRKYYLEWRGPWELYGGLRKSPYEPGAPKTNTYTSPDLSEMRDWRLWNWETQATTGIPVLSAQLDSVDTLDVYALLPLMRPNRVMCYQTRKLRDGLKIRGRANLRIRARSSRPQAAYHVYLYDVTPYGLGTLITHGTFSDHEASANRYHWVDVELVPAAWDIPPGHRLAVAMDTRDPLYAEPTLENYLVTIEYSSSWPSYVELDVEN